jgi:hypothetical protein
MNAYFGIAIADEIGVHIETGIYTGNGVDNRVMNTTLRPDLVMIGKTSGSDTIFASNFKTRLHPGEISQSLFSTGVTNRIQALNASGNGFTLGTSANVNENGAGYAWFALKEIPEFFSIFQYVGNGVDNRILPIPNISTDIEATLIKHEVEENAIWRTRLAVGDASFRIASVGAVTNAIQDFNPGELELGNAPVANADTFPYYGFAWTANSGYVIQSSADDAQEVSGVVTINGSQIGSSLDAITKWAGLRYTLDDINKDSSILYAALAVMPISSVEDEPSITIYVEDSPNAAQFVASANNISSRDRLSGAAFGSTGLGADGTTYFVADESSFRLEIQGIVNNVSFVKGNAIAVLLQGGSISTRDLTIWAYDGGDYRSAVLLIDFIGPIKDFEGDITGSAQVQGDLTVAPSSVQFAGNATGFASVAGTLERRLNLVGAATGDAIVVGHITTGAVELDGSAQGIALITAGLRLRLGLSGNSVGIANVSGSMNLARATLVRGVKLVIYP